MSMDAQLAEIYGTGQEANAEDDQVKLAAAELLVKLAGDNNVDLSQFSDAEVADMVVELQKQAELPPQFQKKEEGEEKKETPESKESGESSSESPEAKKAEAAEKVAEADFLGRVMAHSFAQECKEIEKEAGFKDKAVGAAKGLPAFLKNKGVAASKAVAGAGKSVAKETGHGTAVGRHTLRDQAEKHPWLTAGAAGAAGAAGGAAAMHKKSEAEQRALVMAKEAGWVDPEGNLVAPPAEETKTASPLDLAVERRALEMLEANGYPVTWNE
jgi:hypothetical protein